MKPRWLSARRDRLALMRHLLVMAIGGYVCAFCGKPCRNPQIDHADGRVGYQPRNLSATARLQRYAAEFRAGVRLRPAHKRCNSADGRHRQLTRDQVIAGIDRLTIKQEAVSEESNQRGSVRGRGRSEQRN